MTVMTPLSPGAPLIAMGVVLPLEGDVVAIEGEFHRTGQMAVC